MSTQLQGRSRDLEKQAGWILRHFSKDWKRIPLTIAIVKIRILIDEIGGMRQKRLTMSAFLSFLSALLVSLSSNAAQAEAPESLPGIFRPLSWGMSLKDVHQLFPKARLIESEHAIQERSGKHKKTRVVIISGLTWKHLGESYASIYHDDKRIKLIRIETTESRPECEISRGKPLPKWCRHNYNKELVSALELVRKEISDSYGPPTKYNASTRYVPDPKERGYVWKRKSFDLHLVLSQDEQGVWAITLTANAT